MQQYWCDQWIKIEEERLNFIRYNQNQFKVELYSGLVDAVMANETREAGKFVVLPSSFQNSPRNMQQHFQDGMAVVRGTSLPDLFITYTANPKWREVTENLEEGQTAADRPDLVARVFGMKLRTFIDDIIKNHCFGNCLGYLKVIEFQKRGLPHAHILVCLSPNCKPHCADDYDR